METSNMSRRSMTHVYRTPTILYVRQKSAEIERGAVSVVHILTV